MAITLPGGPDLPGRRRAPKRKKPKLPKGYGVYVSKPKLDPKKFRVVRPGPNSPYAGKYISIRKKAPAPKPKTSGTPGPFVVPGPYDAYKATAPWAIPLLEQIDRDEKFHLGYVTDKVMPWLSTGLQGLTGVGGYNPAVQQQMLGNVESIAGGALGAAAAATPMLPAGTTPGAVISSPNQFLSNAASEAALTRSAGMQQYTQAQSAMNTLQPNTFAQGALMVMADYAKGLPPTYATRRAEARSKIDQFIAEQQMAQAELAEEMRHNKVSEAISAMNAQTNAAIQFGRLGLSADELAADMQQPTGQPPVGYVQLPDGRYVRDPSYVPPGGGGGGGGGTSTRDARGRLRVPVLREKGYTRFGNKPPKKYDKSKFQVVPGADGGWWIKRIGTSGGGTSTRSVVRPKDTQTLVKGLREAYDPLGEGTIAARNAGKPKAAASEVVRYILDRKNSFVASGRKVNMAKLKQVLRASIGGREERGTVIWHIMDILTRGYITPDGRWK